MRTITATACVLVVGLLPVSPAAASCAPLFPAEKDALTDAIFIGRVLSFNERRGRAAFRVLRVRKGPMQPGQRVVVRARPWMSSITLEFRPKPGERWRIGAQERKQGWTTNDCIGTRRLS